MIEVSAVRRSNLPRDDDIEVSSSPTLDQRIVSFVLPALRRQNRCFGIAVTIVLLVATVYVVAGTYSEPNEYTIAEAYDSQTGAVTDQADNAKVQEAIEKHKTAHAHGSFGNPFNGLRGSPFGNHDGNPDDPWSRTNADLNRGDPAWVLERRNQTAMKIAAQELRWNQTHPGVPFPYGYDQGAFNLSSFLTNHPSLIGRLNRTKHGFVDGGSNAIGSLDSTPVDPPTEAPVTPPTDTPVVSPTNSPMEAFPSILEATPGPVEAIPNAVEATPVPETPIPVQATQVPETPVPVQATQIPEMSVSIEATPIPGTPIPETPVTDTLTPTPDIPIPEIPTPVEATQVPETLFPVEVVAVPETPITDTLTPTSDTPIPDTPVPVQATPVPETLLPVQATQVPETPIPVEATQVTGTPDPVKATPLPETPVPEVATPISETPAPVGAAPIPETPIPIEVTPVPESLTPESLTPTVATPLPVGTISDPVEATSLPVETQVPVDYSTWHTATVKLVDGIKYEVLEVIPHDGSSFTQGLTFHNGTLYESTGLYGLSSVQILDVKTGESVNKVMLPGFEFGEGMTYYDGNLLQITWKDKTGHVWSVNDLKKEVDFEYKTSKGDEGWGITYDTVRNELIITDGSNNLVIWDPECWRTGFCAPIRTIPCLRQNGKPALGLNEVEFWQGRVLANVWYEDVLLVIHPETGVVEKEYDMSALWPTTQRNKGSDVFNGISVTDDPDVLYVTGKKWAQIFKIKLLV